MKKPRIFIAIHYMEIGGAEISLIGLLQALDYSRVDVDLFVYAHRGELMPLIPKEVNLLPEIRKYSVLESPMIETLRAGYVDIVVARIIARLKYNIYRRFHPVEKIDDIGIFQYVDNCVNPFLSRINPDVEYDLAVNFCGMHKVVLNKVSAKRRIAWIHTDYATTDANRKCDLRVWSRFDDIISISPQVTDAFLKVYPSLSSKIVEIENMLSPAFVRARSEEFVPAELVGGGNCLNHSKIRLSKES